jgi:hypothetical protein
VEQSNIRTLEYNGIFYIYKKCVLALQNITGEKEAKKIKNFLDLLTGLSTTPAHNLIFLLFLYIFWLTVCHHVSLLITLPPLACGAFACPEFNFV